MGAGVSLIYSVSCFNLADLELSLGGLSLPKPPHGDGTGADSSGTYSNEVGFRSIRDRET